MQNLLGKVFDFGVRVCRMRSECSLSGGETVKANDIKTDKRTAILQAALELIAEKGFHAAPTSKIAQKAGAGVGSIYRYFRDKDELIHAIFTAKEREMSEVSQLGYDPAAPVRVRFIRLCINIFGYLTENPKTFSFLEQYFNSPYGITRKREELLVEETGKGQGGKRHLFTSLLIDAKNQQIVKDLPLAVLHALTFGPMLFVLRDIHSGLAGYEAQVVEKMVEACWDAVKR